MKIPDKKLKIIYAYGGIEEETLYPNDFEILFENLERHLFSQSFCLIEKFENDFSGIYIYSKNDHINIRCSFSWSKFISFTGEILETYYLAMIVYE